MNEGLNQWDALIEDARRRRDRSTGEGPGRPMHTLSGEELYTAHLTPFMQHASTELEGRLRDTQQDNQNMMESIRKQREEIQMIINGLEGVVKDVESSVEAMEFTDEMGIHSLKSEVWALEQDVAAAR